MKYNPSKFENKWIKYWEVNKTYSTPPINKNDKKAYILGMYPYPSGSGLHIGHPRGYLATDVFARFKRMSGFKVIHPMGFDSFGLPAENYAIKTGIHPRKSTDDAIEYFKNQMNSLGFSFDWDKEIRSHDPEFMRWTQWLFLELYKNGLAYQKEAPVNWCPKDQTVLSNEQVQTDGTCERCGEIVVQKNMKQWFFKITKYADELIDCLNNVNWPESTKLGQINWIGRSEGAVIKFEVKTTQSLNSPSSAELERGLGGEVLFATNNKSKIKRLRMIVEKLGLNLQIKTLEDLGLIEKDVDENGTLEENAISKAKAFFGDVQTPIIAMDTGLFIENEKFDPVKVKRNALEAVGKNEADLSQTEISGIIIDFYKSIATKNGGEVSGFFRDAVAIVYPDGKEEVKVADRRISLTNQAMGLDEYFPINTLYKIMPLDKHYHNCSEDEIFEWLTGLREIITSFTQQTFIKVFSTRPDTIFGATFLVISPENDLISKNQDKILNLSEIRDYQELAKSKTELDRQQQKDKTGIKIEGLIAVNPANNKEIQIYVADYVLNSYGTGAIMAVPAHDERDFEFAKKYNLEVKEVVAKEYGIHKTPHNKVNGITAIIFNKSNNKYLGLRWKNDKNVTLLAGGTKDKESYIDTLNREIEEEAGIYKYLENHIAVEKFYSNYWHPEKKQQNFAEGRIYLTIVDETCFLEKTKKEAHENFEVEWFSAEELLKEIINLDESEHWVNGLKKGLQLNITLGFEKNIKSELLKTDLVTETGILFNSEQFDGLNSEEAKSKIVEYLSQKGSAQKKINYRLRDWLVSRQRYWGCPIPIVYDTNGNPHPVKAEHLPLLLPNDVDFKPTGESPIKSSESYKKLAENLYGEGYRFENDTMDTFVDSSWYFLRFIDNKNKDSFADKDVINSVMPVDLYVGGAEHTVLHLMYARFITKVLRDLGYVDIDEPFQKLRHQGMILASDNQKMSKRYGNTIDPIKEVEKYGADTLRVYEMFMGPLDTAMPWNDRAESGVFRFLTKVWIQQDKIVENKESSIFSTKQYQEVNKFIAKVTHDMNEMSYNTSIAKMMEFINFIHTEKEIYTKVWEIFLKLLAPFAPFITEELWTSLGNTTSIHISDWPQYNENVSLDSDVIVGVQINGKLRGTINISKNTSQEEALKIAKSNENINKHINDNSIKKVIYVQGRILNIIV